MDRLALAKAQEMVTHTIPTVVFHNKGSYDKHCIFHLLENFATNILLCSMAFLGGHSVLRVCNFFSPFFKPW